MERETWQRTSVFIEPSQYGFAVVYHLEGTEPAILLHRQEEKSARAMHDLQVRFLVERHGWEIVGTKESTTYLKRPTPS